MIVLAQLYFASCKICIHADIFRKPEQILNIQNVIRAIKTKQIRISDHAKDEAKNDSLLLSDICYSVCHGDIIEIYPKDNPYPSCLIYGKTEDGNHVHSVWAYNEHKEKAVLITVYRPNPEIWINWKERMLK